MTQLMDPPAASPGNGQGGELARRQAASVFAPMAERLGMDVRRLKDLLKATVIKGKDREATEEEMAAFAIVANQYGLNPFTKEIHAFVDRGRIVPIVGIDGWAHIVNAHEQFDGCEFEEAEGPDGKPLRTTCRMYVKGRAKPITVTERYSECFRATDPWRSMPYRMLRHKAFMQASRLAFSISGIFDEDEARDVIANASDAAPQPAGSRTAAVLAKVTARPVSEGQTIDVDHGAVSEAAAADAAVDGQVIDRSTGEVLGEPDTSGSEADSRADQAAPDKPWGVATWIDTVLALNEAAIDAELAEGDLQARVNLWLLSKGAKGKEEKKTSGLDRRDLVEAVREKRLLPDGKIAPKS